MVFTRSCYKAKTIMPNKAPDENENIGMPIYFPLYQKEEMNKN
jgi:hypothetical protein